MVRNYSNMFQQIIVRQNITKNFFDRFLTRFSDEQHTMRLFAPQFVGNVRHGK